MNKLKKEKNVDSEAEKTPPKTMVILSKPTSEKTTVVSSINDSAKTEIFKSESPTPSNFVIKPRESPAVMREGSPALVTKDPDYLLLPSLLAQTKISTNQEDQIEAKLSFPQNMTEPVKLLDELFNWSEDAIEFFQEHSDYYVVGVVGAQGVGKSTILSLLNDTVFFEKPLFEEQSLDIVDSGVHCTKGIDAYITNDRIILLDTQAIFSTSYCDQQIDPKTSNINMKYLKLDYGSLENGLYIQQLQLIGFLMNVCHTVLFVQDWFVDVSMLRFILTAEMLRPTMPSAPSPDSSEVIEDHNPNFVFVQNKCQKSDLCGRTYKKMNRILSTVFNDSKLKCSGNIKMDFIVPKPDSKSKIMNLFLMPDIDREDSDAESASTDLSDNTSYPGLEYMSKNFVQQICSLPRKEIFSSAVTLKSWYHYAARSWEAIKKSTFYIEYSKLMPPKIPS